jgi:hypothetical protein
VLRALEILEPTDHALLRFGALLDLAEVQRLAGRDPREALERARELASGKASPVMVAAAESLVASAAPA